jgi:hypothetical protein
MITSLTPRSVTFRRIPSAPTRRGSGSESGSITASASSAAWNEFTSFEGEEETIQFDYALYALGAGLPDPVNVWKPAYGADSPGDFELSPGSKRCGVRFMEKQAAQMEMAKRILIVGAGALGIRESCGFFGRMDLTSRIRHRSQGDISRERHHTSAFPTSSHVPLPYRDARRQ